MKTVKIESIITLFLLIPLIGLSQIQVSKVENRSINTSADGFYYSLPRTIIKVDMLYQKIEQLRGPLADFTEEYLGTSDFIKKNESTYKLLDISVKPEAQADPNQLYYVQFPLERSKENMIHSFLLSPFGTLAAFNDVPGEGRVREPLVDQTLMYMEGPESFHYDATYNRKRKVDTVVRKITIDTLTFDRFLFKSSWVDKSLKEKANEAALQINTIRESRFNLITGYHEVNFGEGMRYMDQQLKKLEQEYLELFLGKELVTIESQTVYYIPDPNNNSWELYKFPDRHVVSVSVTPTSLAEQLPAKPTQKINSIYYRIPASAFIEISSQGKVYYTAEMQISQLGVNATAPLGNTKLLFDPETGNLLKIERTNN